MREELIDKSSEICSTASDITDEWIQFSLNGTFTHKNSEGVRTENNLNAVSCYSVVRDPEHAGLWMDEAITNLYYVTEKLLESENIRVQGEKVCANSVLFSQDISQGTIDADDGVFIRLREPRYIFGTLLGNSEYNSNVIIVGAGTKPITLDAYQLYDVHGSQELQKRRLINAFKLSSLEII